MTQQDFASSVVFIRSLYGEGFIPLHRPIFEGNERQYLIECIDSNFVSSVGKKVNEFEEKVAEFTNVRFAVATVNGTAALHVALMLAGVRRDDEVISQALTFVATCNALSYAGALPVFVDVDRDTMGMSPAALLDFLIHNTEKRDGETWNRITGRRIAACVPMHTFGIPCRIEEIMEICAEWNIALIEDAAESLGSFVGDRHTGSFGIFGTLSFNGNKIITTGGGGMILTDDESLAKRARHITTTAKIPHPYEFVHDEIGYNYRLPNLNAALGCAQMEGLSHFLGVKQQIALRYRGFFKSLGVEMASELSGTSTNNWLNTLILPDIQTRDDFLAYTNENGIMTRPVWRLMPELEMFRKCQHDGLENSRWLAERIVNIPSSVPEFDNKIVSFEN
jgi:perosamine synthetase